MFLRSLRTSPDCVITQKTDINIWQWNSTKICLHLPVLIKNGLQCRSLYMKTYMLTYALKWQSGGSPRCLGCHGYRG
jgi:hypothetical protein